MNLTGYSGEINNKIVLLNYEKNFTRGDNS